MATIDSLLCLQDMKKGAQANRGNMYPPRQNGLIAETAHDHGISMLSERDASFAMTRETELMTLEPEGRRDPEHHVLSIMPSILFSSRFSRNL